MIAKIESLFFYRVRFFRVHYPNGDISEPMRETAALIQRDANDLDDSNLEFVYFEKNPTILNIILFESLIVFYLLSVVLLCVVAMGAG